MVEGKAMSENMDELIAQMNQRLQEFNERKERLETIKTDLMAAEKIYRQLYNQKAAMQREVEADRAAIRDLEKEKARLLRFKEAEENRKRLLKEYNEQAAVLDELTATATWREFAYEHQIEGGKRLSIAGRGILGDKRGLGKTLTSLIYLDMAQSKKVLIIAPNDVVPQFEGEIQSWAAHRKIMSFAGLTKDQRSIIYPMLRMLDAFVITINYEAWRRDKSIIDDLIAAGIDTVILDEAHRAKSSSKITARGIFQIAFHPNYCPTCDKVNVIQSWMQKGKLHDIDPATTYRCETCNTPLQSTVKNLLSMTGTPILNKPQELFTMLHLVNPFRFASERQFLYDFCYQAGPNRWKFAPGGLERLTKSMSEFFVQRTREDAGISIPPPAIKVHYLDPDPIGYPEQYKAYKDLTTAAALVLEDGTAVSMLYILEIILRERQIITWPAGVELKLRDQNPNSDTFGEVLDTIHFDVHESQKLDAVVELLEELSEEGERWICFSKFKAPLYEGKARLDKKGYMITTATGDDPKYHKEKVRYDFDLKTASDNPRWVGCFATFDAFATGVNLNAARHVIMIDDEWNPGMEDQAIGRIDRLNSVDQANVHIFRVNRTIDTFMERLIEEKRNITEGFESNISAKDMLRHLREDRG
jgi:SNF2 family DNA or RNA helicase